MRWRMLPAAVMLLPTACSILFRMDDITGGGDGGNGSVTGDGAAGGDSSTIEAGVPGALRWCERQAPSLFCKDFDDGQPLSFGWTQDSTPSSGSMSLTTDTVSSPKSAMLAVVSKSGGCENQHFVRRQSFDAAATEVRAETKVWLGTFDGTGQRTARVFSVSLPECSLALYTKAGYAALGKDEWFGGGASTSRPLSRSIEAGRWTHAEIRVKRMGGQTTATVLLDGAVVLDGEPVSVTCGWGRVDVRAGMICAEPMEVRIDDVRIEAR